MDILIVEGGSALVRIRAKDIFSSLVWNTREKFTRRSAYLYIIFEADEYGHLRTTIKDLSEDWGVSAKTVRDWLHYFDDMGILKVSHDRLHWDITLVYEPLKHRDRYPKKIEECRYPHKGDCKGCQYSYVPELSDGGCKLVHRSVKSVRKR